MRLLVRDDVHGGDDGTLVARVLAQRPTRHLGESPETTVEELDTSDPCLPDLHTLPELLPEPDDGLHDRLTLRADLGVQDLGAGDVRDREEVHAHDFILLRSSHS